MPPVPKPKKKKRTTKSVKKACDKLVLEILKIIEPVCVECGKTPITTGHVLSRRHSTIHWDFRNVHSQCWSCNFRHIHYPQYYYDWYIRKYGLDAWQQLVEEGRQNHQYRLPELLELEESLKKKLAIAQQERGML